MIRIEFDRIERIAARFDADTGQDLVAAAQLQRHAIGQGLGGRLNRELDVGIADLVHLSQGGGEGDAKRVGGDFGEFRNVVSELSVLLRPARS